MADPENTKTFYNSAIPGDWAVRKFKDVCESILDGTHFSPKSKEGPIKYITSKNIRNEGLALSNVGYISLEEHEYIYKRCPVRKGDILLTKDGASTGACCINSIDEEFSLLSSVAALRVNQTETTNQYLVQFIKSPFGQKIIKDEISGQAITRITLEKIKAFKVLLPPLPEQKAIAHVLGLVDGAINQNNQLIAQKELRKKWLMQNLLTGKKRLKGFSGEWKPQRLVDFLEPVSRPVDKPEEAFVALGIRSHGKGTFLKPDFQPEKIEMETLYVVRENDLIINITFAWEGAVAIVGSEDDGALVSHRFPTFLIKEGRANVEYFRHFILQRRFRYLLGVISPGGAGRNRVLDKKDFLKMEFYFPNFEEQSKIGQILTAADKEIQLLKTKTEKLREQKKGMMQQLLTGKKRLKIEE